MRPLFPRRSEPSAVRWAPRARVGYCAEVAVSAIAAPPCGTGRIRSLPKHRCASSRDLRARAKHASHPLSISSRLDGHRGEQPEGTRRPSSRASNHHPRCKRCVPKRPSPSRPGRSPPRLRQIRYCPELSSYVSQSSLSMRPSSNGAAPTWFLAHNIRSQSAAARRDWSHPEPGGARMLRELKRRRERLGAVPCLRKRIRQKARGGRDRSRSGERR